MKSEKGKELEKERHDLINEREVEDNIKDKNDHYSSNVKRKYHFTIREIQFIILLKNIW